MCRGKQGADIRHIDRAVGNGLFQGGVAITVLDLDRNVLCTMPNMPCETPPPRGRPRPPLLQFWETASGRETIPGTPALHSDISARYAGGLWSMRVCNPRKQCFDGCPGVERYSGKERWVKAWPAWRGGDSTSHPGGRGMTALTPPQRRARENSFAPKVERNKFEVRVGSPGNTGRLGGGRTHPPGWGGVNPRTHHL